MQTQTPSQTSTKPIVAQSANDSDIIAAANERAAFWKYPLAGPWTVSVALPGGSREVTVNRQVDGRYNIKRAA